MKQWPIYIASTDGHKGCGHQHKTPARAFRCGGGRLPVYKLTRRKVKKNTVVSYEKVIG